jgi:SAM-dependent methyltransferase
MNGRPPEAASGRLAAATPDPMTTPAERYSAVYRGEPSGRVDVVPRGWPRSRIEACRRWAGTGRRVLDIGCGNGALLYNLRDRFAELHGIDLAEARVAHARSALAGLAARVTPGNVEEGAPFPDEHFTLVVCADVLEHVVDVWAAVAEMRRILERGGRLLLTTPNVASLRRRATLLAGRFPSTSAPDQRLGLRTPEEMLDGGHLHYFTFSMLDRILARCSFGNIEHHGFGRLGRLHDLAPSLLSSSCLVLARKG